MAAILWRLDWGWGVYFSGVSLALGTVLEAGYYNGTLDFYIFLILDAFLLLMLSQITLIYSFFKLTRGVEYMGDKDHTSGGEISYALG